MSDSEGSHAVHLIESYSQIRFKVQNFRNHINQDGDVSRRSDLKVQNFSAGATILTKMIISITNIVSLVNGVLWNRFMVATTFSNIPCIWYWARFIIAICQRSDRGPFVQRIH